VNHNETVGALAGGGGTGGTVDLQSNVLTVGGPASTAYAGAIVGSGALNKSGSSTLTLSGPNTYSGGTTNSGGVIAVNHN
jgi:autotransporter-associated beta strand protein